MSERQANPASKPSAEAGPARRGLAEALRALQEREPRDLPPMADLLDRARRRPGRRR